MNDFDCKYEKMLLATHTTFKIGGPARYVSVCNTTDELNAALSWCQQNGVPWFILGNGSNILVADEGFPGQVIKLGQGFKEITFYEDFAEVGGGVLLPALSRQMLAIGWGGFEFMCDIPGTIGGGVRMNAGTKQGEIKDYFVSAAVLTPSGDIKELSKLDLGFGHRCSRLSESRDIVLSATFAKPFASDKETIKKKIKEIIADRRRKQPRNKKNCGSVFNRPAGGKPAGWYIDKAGFKGYQIGDAMVAYEHANWIVNLGNATANDVKTIIRHIQETVFKKFGIALEREVIYVPEDIL
jgi:UDP-N-acetylmuramate dehydrogenase